MKIQIINGPNLNLLGVREPGIYGSNSFESYLPQLKAKYPDVEIDYYQSNIEGELINKLQEVGFSYDGVVLTGGAACQQVTHIAGRSCACLGVICGFGLASYDLAIAGILANQ